MSEITTVKVNWNVFVHMLALSCAARIDVVPSANVQIPPAGEPLKASSWKLILGSSVKIFCSHFIFASVAQFFLLIYSRVSFCDGLFYDDSLLRPLPRRTEHFRLVVHHCRNSSVLSVLSALLALFQCACVHHEDGLSSFAKRSENNKENSSFRD